MNAPQTIEKLTAKDFATDQEVRWCPGCGDYAILKTVQKLMPAIGARRESSVFVSGIGCSSRFPYYMNTYGFHSIHGRAPAIATGIKLANPELDVWVITGDGDGLSIGGNHLLHVLRRNVDLQILLFNNEIYGLTKGQYSPTSKPGLTTPSTPEGSLDSPLAPCAVALGAGARFVGRSIDTSMTHLSEVIQRAYEFPGAAFVEVYQNCNVYNDLTFAHFTDKSVAAEAQVHVRHGEPLRFGRDGRLGLRLDPATLSLGAIEPGRDGFTDDDVLVHDEHNRMLAQMLVSMAGPGIPVAVGVLYCEPSAGEATAASAEYVHAVYAQRRAAGPARAAPDLDALLRRGHTWQVD